MMPNQKNILMGAVGLFALVTALILFFQPSFQTLPVVVAGVVPRQDLVTDERREFFTELAKSVDKPKTIIIVSSNQHSVGLGDIQTTNKEWNAGSGTLSPNTAVSSFLISQNLATDEPASFTDEQGIYSMVSDIQTNFPEATIVPILIKEATKEKILALEKGLREACSKCLMIASINFSQNQPALLAELHDNKSLRELKMLNTEHLLAKVEVDSGPALALLSLWAKGHGAERFNLQNYTNSGVVANDPDLESTTHIFGWYEGGAQIEPEKEVSFIIGGDVMFARLINKIYKHDFTDAFSKLGERVFWGTDASIINLEGAITREPVSDVVIVNDFSFRFSPSVAEALTFLGVNAVSLANNHSDNAGEEGVLTTRSVLENINIQTFGDSRERGVSRIAQFSGHGLTLSVIGINLTYPGQTPDVAVDLIREIKKDPNARVIVMPHWGNEYELVRSPQQEAAAHLWVDNGADMVIGSHPHVVQDAELYKNTPIIYSLGNMLFDQTFGDTKNGLLIAGKFTETGVTFFGLPILTEKYRPQLKTGVAKQAVLDRLYIPFEKNLVTSPAGTQVVIEKK
jgi:poly-gamma-glutamate synthesis protein (capsule biosynthesis protein)